MSNKLIVVGIGSSAGGLEALQVMLSNLPDIPQCAYIIAQHLSPTHKSMMVQLLRRTTNIPVVEVQDGMKIEAKTIYMTPQNQDVFVQEGKLYFKDVVQSFGPKPSVNYFFSSLASDFGNHSVGVILSGTGSDGAYGIRAIKAEGGITIAQSPNSSKYDGMPLSAINTGKVDLVVSIENISNEITKIVQNKDKNLNISPGEFTLQNIFKILFDEFGVDFSLYKKSTLTRRLERRLVALKIDSLKQYYNFFKNDTQEMNNLYHDILIGVTSFFRDKKSFELLHTHIKKLLSKKEHGDEIRFWSIGCSTGEEVYSLAIMLSEILQESISKYKIKIFATDIDNESLKIARAGVYAETTLDNLDKDLIKKYFNFHNNQFEVKKELRELVIFSRHNIISDSPFLRLDLVVCRNMLIYFSQALQDKFFPIIHYALKENALLFLGKSESIGNNIDLFSLLDNNAKIFKAQYTGVKEPPKLFNYSSSYKNYTEPKLKPYKNEEELLEEKITQALSKTVLDKSVVVNSSYDVIYVKGDIPYLRHTSGRISNNIFKLISNDISLDLRSALTQANKTKKSTQTPFRSVSVFEDIIKYIRIIIVPNKDDRSDDWFFILFFQSEDAYNIKGHACSDESDDETVRKLTLELDSTKSHLQNVIEELETSYEEMQSLNEELQSSNEELQSSNEELETTNEELQSTNEELQTAYSELKDMYEEKQKRTNQLENLMEKLKIKTEDFRKQKELTEAILNTAPIAVIMCDTNGNITYTNDFAQGLLAIQKQRLLQMKYNDKNLGIKDGLPFEQIKESFESIYNLSQTLTTKIQTLKLSVSGAALFDLDSTFQGAVFCIENTTHFSSKEI